MKKLHPLLLSLLFLLPSCSYYFGTAWRIKPDKSRQISAEKTFSNPKPDTGNYIIKHWANRPLPDWKTKGKVDAPRVMLAKLLTGKDLDSVNQYLTGKTPWGKNGSDWAFNKHGDYDFSEVPLSAIQQLFGDGPLLKDSAKQTLLRVLLTHCGNKTSERTPGLRIMRETENHILMGETSRYLKNQWLHEHGDTTLVRDNDRNGLNQWWWACLQQKLDKGFFEFNANPYSSYSVTALLTFHTFCHNAELKRKCADVLDMLFTRYAYSSLGMRRYPPYRRRMEREKVQRFSADPITSIVKALLLKDGHTVEPAEEHLHHSLLAYVSDYHLPDSTVALLVGKKPAYFYRWGHGKESCPEIYSGSADYLLSAGGSQRTIISQIVARPITLFLNDSAIELKQCFHITGRGKMKRWNNTGVYEYFAVGTSPVNIPSRYQPVENLNGWSVFQPYPGKKFYVLVYNKKHLGLMAIFPEGKLTAKEALSYVLDSNKPENLRTMVWLPTVEGISYNLHAIKTRWVIKTFGERLIGRWHW
jgi:hypothetical protein